MGGELGGPRPWLTRGVREAEAPGLQVHGAPTGVRGLAPGLVG